MTTSPAKPSIHQLLEVAIPADAQSNLAMAIRRWLIAAGHPSQAFAATVHPDALDVVKPLTECQAITPSDILIYHVGASGAATEVARSHAAAGGRLVIYYHCFTPPAYFREAMPELSAQLVRSPDDLHWFADLAALGVADSEFGASHLRLAGYSRVGIVSPVLLDDRWNIAPVPGLLDRFGDGWTNLLYVGRVVPNKRQEDVINTYSHYRRLNEESRLLLVGACDVPLYTEWLERRIEALGLHDVHLCGHVSQAELNAYYRVAHVYISMSEHEGFGVPLVESMHMGVPVLAYKSSAVAETVGDGGILVQEKDFPVIAELIHLLVADGAYRQGIIERQRRRAEAYGLQCVERSFWQALALADLVPLIST